MVEQIKRISIRDKKFSGVPSELSVEDTIHVIIVGIAYVSRIYYAETYDPEKISSPTCWSTDTDAPAANVPEHQRQAGRCLDCTHNIKGSGYGRSRACRFVQKLAVVLEDDLDTVYQLQLPSTSIFGNAVDGQMPLRAYARYLEAQETPIVALTTRIYFDGDSNIPKLFFRPERPLSEQELAAVTKMVSHSDTVKAITCNVVPVEDVEVSPFLEVDGFKLDD